MLFSTRAWVLTTKELKSPHDFFAVRQAVVVLLEVEVEEKCLNWQLLDL